MKRCGKEVRFPCPHFPFLGIEPSIYSGSIHTCVEESDHIVGSSRKQAEGRLQNSQRISYLALCNMIRVKTQVW